MTSARSAFALLFIFWEAPTCQPHRCAWEDHGAHPPRNSAKAHGEQGGDSGQRAGFSKGKPCLTSLMAFSDRVAQSVGKMSPICTALWPFIQSHFNLVLLSKVRRDRDLMDGLLGE